MAPWLRCCARCCLRHTPTLWHSPRTCLCPMHTPLDHHCVHHTCALNYDIPSLLFRLVDPEQAPKLIASNLNAVEKRILITKLGRSEVFLCVAVAVTSCRALTVAPLSALAACCTHHL